MIRQKVLVLGSTGMLGHQVVNYFLQFDKYEIVDIAYKNKLTDNTIIVNVTNKELLGKTIVDIKPDFIVNCIGVLINGANQDIANAIYINAYLPHKLKNIAKNINAKLIHISTDCVFSGKRGQYIESDEKDGKDIYAQTKSLGEVIDNVNLTFRTSIIGPELKTNGEGLFHWFMQQSGAINGFTKAIWSGVTTLELAKAVHWAIENDIRGLYHITNNSSISKYELLMLFKKYTKKQIEINKIGGKDIDKSFIDTRKELDYQIPSYEVMIEEMIELIKSKPKLYGQYMKYINV